MEAERWRGVAAAERSSAARADHDRQQRAQKDLDTSKYFIAFKTSQYIIVTLILIVPISTFKLCRI